MVGGTIRRERIQGDIDYIVMVNMRRISFAGAYSQMVEDRAGVPAFPQVSCDHTGYRGFAKAAGHGNTDIFIALSPEGCICIF